MSQASKGYQGSQGHLFGFGKKKYDMPSDPHLRKDQPIQKSAPPLRCAICQVEVYPENGIDHVYDTDGQTLLPVHPGCKHERQRLMLKGKHVSNLVNFAAEKKVESRDICPGCNFHGDLKDGLCPGCRTLLKHKGPEIYRNTVSDVQVVSRTQDSLMIAVKFSKDVKAKIRAFQRENIGAGGRKKSGLVEPLYVLGVILESKKIQGNNVKIKLEYTRGRRFGRMISGGRYDFAEGVDEGYLVHVTSDFDDGCLLPIVTKALREDLKFGCHVSNLSVDGFLKDEASSQGLTILLDRISTILPIKIKNEIANSNQTPKA